MMKRTLVAVLVWAAAVTAWANPPSDIKLTVQGTTVNISIMHPTKDVLKHYIVEVRVTLNGKEVIRQTYVQQAAPDSQSAVYVIPSLKAGDSLTVYARCNIYGDRTKKFMVGK